MKQTISSTQEVEVMEQIKVSTAVIASIKVNKKSGSIDCACNCLSEVMHKNSESLGDRVYGNITSTLLKYDTKWTSKTLEYHVEKLESEEYITLTLVRTKYTYNK